MTAGRALAGRLRGALTGRDWSFWVVLGIGAVALVARLAVAHRLGHVRGYDEGDQADYRSLAYDIIGGNGYRAVGGGRTAFRSPGYPLFLAGVIRLGHAVPVDLTIRTIVGIAQAVVGTVTVIVAGFLGRRLCGPVVGVVAAAVLALWPSLVVMTGVTLTETLFTCLLLIAIAVAFWSRHPGVVRMRWAGVILGLAVLTRPAAVPVVAVIAVSVWVGRVDGRKARRVCGAFGAGFVVALLPWMFRNILEMGAFIPTDTHGGYALCQSNRPGAGPEDPADPYCDYRAQSEVANDRRLRNRALRWMATHPGSEAVLIVQRAGVLLREDGDIVGELVDPEGPDPAWTASTAESVRRLADWFWWALLLPAAFGVAVLCRRQRTRWMAAAYLSVMALPLLVTAVPRFHQPMAPLLALGVGVTVQAAVRFVCRARVPRRSTIPAG